MIKTGYYLATRDVAERCGNIDDVYRVKDGRFVLSDRRLKRINLLPEEYATGIKGITQVSEDEAIVLISANGYKKGLSKANSYENDFANEFPQAAKEEEKKEEEPEDNNELNKEE